MRVRKEIQVSGTEQGGGFRPFVFGNLGEERIPIDNREAVDRFGNIADFSLVHDREILLRCDDSVVRQNGPKLEVGRVEELAVNY